MNVKRLLLGAVAAAALAGLAGCTTLASVVNDIGTVAKTNIVNPVDDAQVTQLGNTLGALNGVVVGYSKLPLCPKGHSLTPLDYCHDKGLLVALDADMHVAYIAYQDLVNFQRNNPKGTTVVGGSFSSWLAQAKGAVNTIKQLVAAYKVGG